MNGETLRAILGENIKRHRASRGLSQEKLAEIAEISANFLSAIETGRKWPYPETLASLADAMGLTVGHFFVEDRVPSDFIDSVATRATEALFQLNQVNNHINSLINKCENLNFTQKDC
jgi:transcriptional regulator with XRE-family HTH domain